MATPHFDGATYDPAVDGQRLKSQLERVKALMSDQRWRTLREIAHAVNGSESGVSARLRDCRKRKFGALIVESRRKEGKDRFGWPLTVWEYRVTLPPSDKQMRLL